MSERVIPDGLRLATPCELEAAAGMYLDPENVQVDDHCLVADADGGRWVQLWHWLSDDEMERP